MIDLNTDQYINLIEVNEEISEKETEIDRLENEKVKMAADHAAAEKAGYEKVVDACQSTIYDLHYELQELEADLNKLNELVENITEYNTSDQPEVINEDHLEEHVKDWTGDVYGVDIHTFPFCYINWENAIENLSQQDYKTIEFEGATFWVKVN